PRLRAGARSPAVPVACWRERRTRGRRERGVVRRDVRLRRGRSLLFRAGRARRSERRRWPGCDPRSAGGTAPRRHDGSRALAGRRSAAAVARDDLARDPLWEAGPGLAHGRRVPEPPRAGARAAPAGVTHVELPDARRPRGAPAEPDLGVTD